MYRMWFGKGHMVHCEITIAMTICLVVDHSYITTNQIRTSVFFPFTFHSKLSCPSCTKPKTRGKKELPLTIFHIKNVHCLFSLQLMLYFNWDWCESFRHCKWIQWILENREFWLFVDNPKKNFLRREKKTVPKYELSEWYHSNNISVYYWISLNGERKSFFDDVEIKKKKHEMLLAIFFTFVP